MKKYDILNILHSNKTVFSFKDILLMSQDKNPALLIKRLNYHIGIDQLYRIRKGIYAKDKNYNKYEAATKIYTPAYISFETVLSKAGIIFQYNNQISVASYLTREIIVDKHRYSYRKIKDIILTNSAGIEHKENYSIATKERAFLDMIYLNKNYYFDNISNLDWNKVFEILPIYSNKRMKKEVINYQKNI